KTILNVASQLVANLAVLAQPFLPKTATKLFEMLNFPQGNWNDAGNEALIQDGHQLGEVQLLFDKITDEQVDFQLNKLAEAKLKNRADNTKVAPAKENISFDDFVKMDIRVG